MTKAVLFDLDGTLVDTAPDLIGSLNKLLDETGRPGVKTEAVRPHVSGGSEAIIRAGLGAESTEAKISQLRPRYLAIYEANLYRFSCLFPGMDKVLEHLESYNIPWGIVTNKPSYLTQPLLQQMDLEKRCCSIVSADTTAQKKPHPDPILYACRQCGIPAKDSIYIGDDLRDIQAGNAAGMRTLAAAWGYYLPEDQIETWPATAILNHPLEILDHL